VDAGQIVMAAVQLIDELGVDGCTMRAIADQLGVTPMSIYRHVKDKQDLLGRIPDSLLGPVAADVVRRRRAVPALRAVADGLAEVLDQHPHLTPVFQHPQRGPAMTRAAEHCVQLLIAEGCPPEEAFEVLRSVVALVIGQAATSHGARSDLGVKLILAGVEASLRR
jgi:AcrR family transcriptional regulator